MKCFYKFGIQCNQTSITFGVQFLQNHFGLGNLALIHQEARRFWHHCLYQDDHHDRQNTTRNKHESPLQVVVQAIKDNAREKAKHNAYVQCHFGPSDEATTMSCGRNFSDVERINLDNDFCEVDLNNIFAARNLRPIQIQRPSPQKHVQPSVLCSCQRQP